MKRVPFIEQMNQTECGLCSVLSILQYYGSKEKLLDIRNDYECGRDGYSLAKLRSIFEKRDMEVKTYSAKSILALKKVSLPCIAFWDNKHFVVIEKVTDKNVMLMDPACGHRKLDIENAENHFSRAIMLASPSEKFVPRKSQTTSPWKFVLKTLAENKLRMGLAIVFAVCSYLILISIPDKTSDVINKAIETANISSIVPTIKALLMLCVLFLSTTLLRSTNIMISNTFFCRKIERSTFRHLLRLPYKFFESRNSGDILYRISSLSGFRELFTTQVISGVVDIGTIIFIFIFMVRKSLLLTFCVIVLSILNFLFLLITKEPIATSINNEVTEQSELQSIENECLVSISSIKTAGLEESEYKIWDAHLENLIKRYKQRYSMNNFYSSMTSTFQVFAPLVVLIVGILQFFQSKISIGEIIAFQSLASTLFSSELSVFGSYTQFILASAYLSRVNDIWCEEEEKAYTRPVSLEMKGNIEMRNLTFSYSRDSQAVLNGISFSVRPGERVAFVGKSGAGKSSIGKILAGLYEVEEGMLFFDGVDVNRINKASFSKNIGVIPQEIYLLSRTIYENIVWNDEDISRQDVIDVCTAINIHDEISEMPMGYQTFISEMGMNLSGGQRQRIALARALIHKPKIIIMDEATSALDSINEKNVTDYLREIGCTQIIIAHRLSTIIDADRIFVVSDGKIVEEGVHDELLQKQGEYYKLYINGEK